MFEKDQTPLYEEKDRFLFWSYYFKVYPDRIEAYFTPHQQIIPISNVEQVELVDKIPKIIGRGLRYGRKRTKYFVIRDEGLRLIMKRGRWKSIVLSVKEPERVKTIIEERIGHHEPVSDIEEITQTV